jgi:hypothetical protein
VLRPLLVITEFGHLPFVKVIERKKGFLAVDAFDDVIAAFRYVPAKVAAADI